MDDPSNIAGLLTWLYNFIADQNNLIIVALISLGFILKCTKRLHDDLIPLILLIVGIAAGYVYLTSPLKGVIYTAVSIILYRIVLKKWIDKFIATQDNSDTFIDKAVDKILPQKQDENNTPKPN